MHSGYQWLRYARPSPKDKQAAIALIDAAYGR